MTSPGKIAVALGDVAMGFASGFLANELLPGEGTPHKMGTLGVAALGAAASNYLQTHYESAQGDEQWALQNPVTITILSLGLGTLTQVGAELVLPELTVWSPRLLIAGSFTVGTIYAIKVGPSVGAFAQIVAYVLGKTVGIDLPEPSLVKDSKGVKDIPAILWRMARDMVTVGIMQDNVDPMIDAMKKISGDGVGVNLYWLAVALFDFVTLVPGSIYSMFGQILWHTVQIFAAIIHSAKFPTS